jgi:hypothetical protein
MGVDLTKVKKRQQEEEQKEAARLTGGVRRWSPKTGTNNIRIMPPWTDEGPNAGDFAREVYTHWRIGTGDNQMSFTCPLKTPALGDPCPVCEKVEALRATGDPTDAERASEMQAKQGFLSNVVDLDDPVFTQEEKDQMVTAGRDVSWDVGDTKIQTFRYGPMIYKQLIDYLVELGDITDLVAGQNVVIKKTGAGKQGTKYNVFPKGSAPVQVIGQPVEKAMYNLDALNKPRTTAEMLGSLSGNLAQSASPGLPSSPQPVGLPPPPAQPVPQQEDPSDIDEEPAPVDAPECFKDTVTFATDDPECAGGLVDGETLDQCPFYQECGTHAGKLTTPKTSRRRKKAAENGAPAATAEADALIKQMENMLHQGS